MGQRRTNALKHFICQEDAFFFLKRYTTYIHMQLGFQNTVLLQLVHSWGRRAWIHNRSMIKTEALLDIIGKHSRWGTDCCGDRNLQHRRRKRICLVSRSLWSCRPSQLQRSHRALQISTFPALCPGSEIQPLALFVISTLLGHYFWSWRDHTVVRKVQVSIPG